MWNPLGRWCGLVSWGTNYTLAVAYLDHAATTPLRPEAAAAMVAADLGNPSSLHASGRAARRRLEEARESLAGEIGVEPGDVIFTSGGTEADNVAVTGIFRARRAEDPKRRLVVVSAIEHHAVLDTAEALRREDAEVARLPVSPDGFVSVEALQELVAVRGDEIAVISVMAANNETGAIQPLEAVARVADAAGLPLHTDAVQAVGPNSVATIRGVAMSISAHKFGGPVGIGALVLPTAVPCLPVIHGGGQERGIHSGTLNVAGAIAMSAALRAARADTLPSAADGSGVDRLRDRLVTGILAEFPDAQVNTPLHNALPGIANIGFPGCEGDALLMLLDAVGVEVSTGSACTAGIPRPSHVLLAMGRSTESARSALRFSFGWSSTSADVSETLAALPAAVARSRRATPPRSVIDVESGR